MREEFKIIKAELDEFRYSFPEKFYVCNVKEDKKKKNKKPDQKQVHFIATEIASCFSVLRE